MDLLKIMKNAPTYSINLIRQPQTVPMIREDEHQLSHDHEHDGQNAHAHEHSEGGWIPLAVSGVTIALGLVLRYIQGATPISDLLLLTTMILSGYKIAEMGLRSLLRKHISINLLIPSPPSAPTP